MKNTILTTLIVLLSVVPYSQVITVATKGLQVYFRPKNLTLSECHEKNLINHKYFGNGDCLYVFDLNTKVFTMKPQYVDWESTFKITDIRSNDNILDLTTEDGTAYLITDSAEHNDEIFLIEYFDLPDEVEGRFAKKEDFTVKIE